MFPCESCGVCCRNLDKSEIYIELDGGNGVCKYLSGNQCTIYHERPIICRIDECYDLFFSEFMDKYEYYKLNKVECKKLKEKEDD